MNYVSQDGYLRLQRKIKRRMYFTALGCFIMYIAGSIFILICLLILWATAQGEMSQGFTPEEQKQIIRRIDKYCRERGVKPTVVEIHYDGRMFYQFNGKRCEIKG